MTLKVAVAPCTAVAITVATHTGTAVIVTRAFDVTGRRLAVELAVGPFPANARAIGTVRNVIVTAPGECNRAEEDGSA